MSLLEDVFLEDEAGEAQELERVIEGDEFDERPGTPNSNDDSEKEDEAEEDKRRVDHTAKAKRAVKNPRFVLNPARLTGPRGIQVIPEHFKDFKFKGKGHEREDLDCVLKKLEHWAYRLYPKFKFDDCLKKIETLGKKRPVMVHLHKIRTDQFMSEETVVQKDSSDDETEAPVQEDEFDRLLQQQIELARSTPAPGSVRKELHTPRSPLAAMAPKAFSSPSISDEQKQRMIRNKKLAEERRLAKLNQLNNSAINKDPEENRAEVITKEANDEDDSNVFSDADKGDNIAVVRKHNRSNIIDSSDDESDVMTVNVPISVDVHNTIDSKDPSHDTKNTESEKMIVESEEKLNSDTDRDDNIVVVRKHNRSNVIDSSDDESDVKTVNESISVDVHNTVDNKDPTQDTKNTETEKMAVDSEEHVNNDTDRDDNIVVRKHNRSNVIDSSDDESDVMTVNESISVDVHNTVDNKDPSHDKNNTESKKMAVDSEESMNSNDAEIEVGNVNSINNEGIVIETDSKQRKTTEENSDEENTASEAITVECQEKIKSDDVEIVGKDRKNNDDKVIETDSNRHLTLEDAISDSENTASEITVESERNVNSVDEEIDTNISNKDKVIEANSFDHIAKEDTLSKRVSTIESDTKMIHEDTSNDKTMDENDPNSVNIANLSNNVNRNVDEALTVTDKQSKDKNNQIENNEVPIEDLMDVDFSDDF